MTLILHIPTVDYDTASRIARAVRSGKLPMRPYYASDAAARAWAAQCNEWMRHETRVYAVPEDDAPSIPHVLDRAGELAAGLMLFVAAPMALAACWGMLS